MEHHFFHSTFNRALGSLALVVVVIALLSYAYLTLEQAKHADMMPATISVAGKGEVLAVPDLGQFSFTVQAEGVTAEEAQSLSATKTNAILAYLKEQGIEDKDIKTEGYNLSPRFRFDEQPCPINTFCPPGEQIADGFEVFQTVMVKVRQTDKAGAIIAGVGEREATNISGLTFTIDDTDALKAQAQAAAIVDARAKAAVLADQLGVELVRIVSYYEDMGSYPMYESAMAMDMKLGDAMSPELPMGEDATRVTVNVTYEVK
jgi:hypothetical protein